MLDKSDETTAVVLQIPYFEDVGVITLQYLDMLVQKDNLQKSQFFKGLPKVIEKLPLVGGWNHCVNVALYLLVVLSAMMINLLVFFFSYACHLP